MTTEESNGPEDSDDSDKHPKQSRDDEVDSSESTEHEGPPEREVDADGADADSDDSGNSVEETTDASAHDESDSAGAEPYGGGSGGETDSAGTEPYGGGSDSESDSAGKSMPGAAPGEYGDTGRRAGDRRQSSVSGGQDGVACPSCGAEIDRNASFCTNCGAEQTTARGREHTGRGPRNQASGTQTDNRRSHHERGARNAGTRHGRRAEQTDRYDQSGHGRAANRGQWQDGRAYNQTGYGGSGRTGRAWTAGPDSNTGMAALAHLLGLFMWLVGPLLIYAVTDDPFVKQNAAYATNWQIMLTIYMTVSGFLLLVIIGFFLIFILILVNLAFIVIATVKASDGEAWQYPLTPDLL